MSIKTDCNNYFILDETNIPTYLKSISIFKDFAHASDLEIQSIGDGNLNNVFRVIQGHNSIIIKQALPYLKIAGPEYELSFERIAFEIEYYNEIAKITTEGLPKIYYTDRETMKLIIMQDLNQHIVMRTGLIDQQQFPNFNQQISEFIAKSVFYTSRLYLNQVEYEKLKLKFNNNFLCKLTEEFIFTFPYFNHPTNNKLTFKPAFSEQFICNAWVLRNKFNTANECLSHGDLHTGSIMLNQKELYVIDSEFAFMGPASFDLGLLIANFITMLIANNKNPDYQKMLKTSIIEIWHLFKINFCSIWANNLNSEDKEFFGQHLDIIQTKYLHNLLNEVLGFAGMEICRRICGIAGVKEIRGIENETLRTQMEIKTLAIGQKIVENYSTFATIEELFTKIL